MSQKECRDEQSHIKVSIITVCYNSEKTIEKTIKSVLGQTYDNIEYIIVDGASSDGTMDIVSSYRDSFGDRMTVISEPDDGIYYAMNKGIERSAGELIGIINSDDWYEADAVEKVVEAYNEHHENPLTVYYGLTGIIRDGGMLEVARSFHDNLENEMILHPSCFVTKAAYDRIGVFDTGYTSAADYDLMLRYKRSGQVDFVPVEAHIANFVIGGMCSTGKAYIDLLKLKMDYGKISKVKGYMEIIKARLAETMEKNGKKPIQTVGK